MVVLTAIIVSCSW